VQKVNSFLKILSIPSLQTLAVIYWNDDKSLRQWLRGEAISLEDHRLTEEVTLVAENNILFYYLICFIMSHNQQLIAEFCQENARLQRLLKNLPLVSANYLSYLVRSFTQDKDAYASLQSPGEIINQFFEKISALSTLLFEVSSAHSTDPACLPTPTKRRKLDSGELLLDPQILIEFEALLSKNTQQSVSITHIEKRWYDDKRLQAWYRGETLNFNKHSVRIAADHLFNTFNLMIKMQSRDIVTAMWEDNPEL